MRCIDEAAVRLHEFQLDATGQGGGDLFGITPHRRRQRGVEHGGFGARHELDQRAGLMRQADLGETGGAREYAGGELVHRIFPGVQKGDGAGAEAAGTRDGKRPSQAGFVERLQNGASDRDAFARFDNTIMQRRRLADVEREDVRPRLVADFQCIAEAGRGDQHDGFSGMSQQGVGADGSAHLHPIDRVRRQRLPGLQSEQVANACNCRIGIAFRRLGQQLGLDQPALRRSRDDVGERAAAINPELPARGQMSPVPSSSLTESMNSCNSVSPSIRCFMQASPNSSQAHSFRCREVTSWM